MKWKVVFLTSGYCLLVASAATISVEHGIGVAALIGTLHGIVALLKKHGEVVLINPSESLKSEKAKSSAFKPGNSAQTKQEVSQIAGLDTSVFKQFQSNLQGHQANAQAASLSNEKGSKTADSKRPAQIPAKSPNPYAQAETARGKASFNETLAMEQEDKVVLSKKENPPIEKPKKKLSSPKTAVPVPQKQKASAPEEKVEDENQNLFEELSKPLDNVPEDLFADVQITLPSEEARARKKELPPAGKIHDFFDEGLGESLQATHSPEEKEAEAAALLKIARNSFQAGHVSEAKAGMDNFFLIQQELGESPDWEVRYLYARICLKLGDVVSATASFSEMLEKGLDSKHPDYPKILESITSSLEEHQMIQEELPFLYDLLNYYRHELDRPQMDVTYERIERVLEEMGDDERLIRIYKNHLEIKRILKDQYGEGRLLDAIGNRYYKMGEKELSRKYYEENLHLKALMNKVESP
ncbi:MAG: hypothetical protein HQM13_22955 [SAR324 cluster bacterium]|nr:hypothetical protein [SAR324 cluster bacterium]